MCAVTQRLVLALSATAQLDQRSYVQIELSSVLIKQLKVPLDMNTSIALDSDFCGHDAFLARWKDWRAYLAGS